MQQSYIDVDLGFSRFRKDNLISRRRIGPVEWLLRLE